MEDPNAWNAREVLSLRSYIFAVPHFCEQHLAYAPMIGSSCRDAIIALKLSSQQAFEAYLNLIATKAGRPELLNVSEKADLRAGKDDRGADVFFLRMR